MKVTFSLANFYNYIYPNSSIEELEEHYDSIKAGFRIPIQIPEGCTCHHIDNYIEVYKKNKEIIAVNCIYNPETNKYENGYCEACTQFYNESDDDEQTDYRLVRAIDEYRLGIFTNALKAKKMNLASYTEDELEYHRKEESRYCRRLDKEIDMFNDCNVPEGLLRAYDESGEAIEAYRFEIDYRKLISS